MTESSLPDDGAEILAKARKLGEDLKTSQQHTEQFLRLNDELEEDRRKNASFLIDKSLPVLTAIVGGIAYVLLEHKAQAGWPLNCFRIAGGCLTLSILVIFVRAWLEPFFVYHQKIQLLAIKHQQKRPSEPWLYKHFDAFEEIRLAVMLILTVGGLSLAAIGTLLQSG